MLRPTVFILATAVVVAFGTTISEGFFQDFSEADPVTSTPLFLTPLIKQQKYLEAKTAAKVSLLDVTSYSGLITVDEVLNNYLFFWYFPAQGRDPKKSPTIIWLGSGPGLPSVFGLFYGNGPYKVVNNTLSKREDNWNIEHNVLYIDNPIGTGYSGSSKPDQRNKDIDVTEYLNQSISQLVEVFPEIKSNELYISGESFGAKYVVTLSHAIYSQQSFNLMGVLVGSGWMDPKIQIDYGNYLQEHGLIDGLDFEDFDDLQKRIYSALDYSNYEVASELLGQLITNFTDPDYPTLFQNKTGFKEFYSTLGKETDDWSAVSQFIQTSKMRDILHVGDLPFNNGDLTKYFLTTNLTKSVKPLIEDLLINGIKMLFFNGQHDILCNYQMIEDMVGALKISVGAGDVPRKRWYVNGRLAGYWTDYNDLSTVLIRQAGHFTLKEQSEWILNMVNHFTGAIPTVHVDNKMY